MIVLHIINAVKQLWCLDRAELVCRTKRCYGKLSYPILRCCVRPTHHSIRQSTAWKPLRMRIYYCATMWTVTACKQYVTIRTYILCCWTPDAFCGSTTGESQLRISWCSSWEHTGGHLLMHSVWKEEPLSVKTSLQVSEAMHEKLWTVLLWDSRTGLSSVPQGPLPTGYWIWYVASLRMDCVLVTEDSILDPS